MWIGLQEPNDRSLTSADLILRLTDQNLIYFVI